MSMVLTIGMMAAILAGVPWWIGFPLWLVGYVVVEALRYDA